MQMVQPALASVGTNTSSKLPSQRFMYLCPHQHLCGDLKTTLGPQMPFTTISVSKDKLHVFVLICAQAFGSISVP